MLRDGEGSVPTHQSESASESADNMTIEGMESPVSLFISTVTTHHLPK